MFLEKIESERLILRPYLPEDTSSWQKWDIAPEIQRYLPEPKNEPISEDEQLDYLKECEEEEDGVYWSVVGKESDKLIGTVSITQINTHHGAGEINVIIGEKDYWGKGFATEALELAIKAVAERLKLRRISAELEEGNIGMQKAFEKLGFELESLSKESRIKEGKPINTLKYFKILS